MNSVNSFWVRPFRKNLLFCFPVLCLSTRIVVIVGPVRCERHGKLLDENYEKRTRFLDEFEWYVSAFAKQRESGVLY